MGEQRFDEYPLRLEAAGAVAQMLREHAMTAFRQGRGNDVLVHHAADVVAALDAMADGETAIVPMRAPTPALNREEADRG